MNVTWSDVQARRLKELDAAPDEQHKRFETIDARNKAFQALEKILIKNARLRLNQLRDVHLRPALCRLESALVQALNSEGFVQVKTPVIMSRALLARMTIDENHPLFSQVFWLEKDKCLRPMLAPHLYYLLKDLLRLWEKPVRIFEIGSCFRKESQGSLHSAEFTMLNLVEMGLPEENRRQRLEELAALVTRTAGVAGYELETQESAVYGQTVDVTAARGNEKLELGSAAVGPHPLDRPWRITDAWVGIGFGLERLIMAARDSRNIARLGPSLTYLDGVRLNV
jgi:phenylalanyl-tRNA synthetase alpha chain